MSSATKLLFTAGLICGALGVAWSKGLLAVLGVVLLVAGLLLRSLTPARRVAPDRPRFGPTTVASTVGDAGGRPIDITPRD
jgi:hypothetical protein